MGVAENAMEFIRALRTSPKRDPIATASAVVTSNSAQMGKANVHMFRNWARGSEWVRAAINIRNNQIATAEWDIVPVDETKRYSKRLQEQLRRLFSDPNPEDNSFAPFAMKVVEDILTLDAGVIEKERSLDGTVRRVWSVDGGKIKVNALWDGDPEETRFYWYPLYNGDVKDAVPFKSRDMVYLMQNPVSYMPLGVSPLETLKYAIDAMLAGDEYNVRQVRGAAPDGMIDLGEGANDKQVNEFRRYWMAEVAGKGAMAFVGGSKGAKFHPFRQSNRDMQFLEFQVWYVRKVAAVMGLSPQDLGLTMDINRANAEQQAEQTEDRGQRPLMALVQEGLTREIVWDEQFGGEDNNLAFRFKRLNLKESMSKASINEKALGGAPWKTIDEARIDDGRAPIGGKLGNSLVMKVANGVVLLGEDTPTAGELMKLQNQPKPAPALPGGGKKPDAPAGD
jgi:phage portal protein BeeE